MPFWKKHQAQPGASNHPKHFLLILLIAGLSACGGGSSSSSDPEPPVIGVEEGILLEGVETSAAIESTVNRAPTPVPIEYIQDRLLTSRLVAVLDLNATVAEVNQALTDNAASIVTMLEDQPFMTLAIDPVADLAEARARAEALKDSGAFVYVRPGFQAPSVSNAISALGASASEIASQHTPPLRPANRQSAEGYVDHVLSSRFPAAWNVSRAASHDASLVLPMSYASLEEIGQYDELPLLSVFELGDPINTSDPVFGGVGNLGYQYLGIAAGENLFDGTQNRKLGADPVAIQYLDAFGYHTDGLDENDLWTYLYLQWPASGNTVIFIDNSYNDPDQLFYSYLDRAWSGFFWRRIAHSIETQYGPLLMLTPTGIVRNANTPDDVAFNSAFAVATLANIQAMVYLSNGASAAEQQAFIDFYNQTVANSPSLAAPLENVLLVGSSDADGNESSFSWPGAQVRAVGENVVGPCLVNANNFCDSNGNTLTSNSTMAATAQVAGLASYLWHIDNQLTPAELLLRLQHAYSSSDIPGVIDARTAVLSLDTSMADAPLRKTLLDVSGPGGQPDGVFDESDVTAFLNAFDAFEGATTPYWSVYDLNGDGWTNGSGTARMDLDVNDLPGFTTVTQVVGDDEKSFDETAVTDSEVLCFYVFSNLYAGGIEEVPTIPNCQSPPAPAQLTLLTGFSSSLVASYGTLGLPQEDTHDPESLSSYTVTTTATLDGDPEFTSASGKANSSETFTMTEDSQGQIVLSLTFSGNSSANASQGGYVGLPGQKSVNASAFSLIEATIYLSESLSFELTGSFNGGGSGEIFQGLGYISFWDVSNNSYVFIDQYDSDDNGTMLRINESGALPAGFYRLSVRVDAGAITGNRDGGSSLGSGTGQITLQLSR